MTNLKKTENDFEENNYEDCTDEDDMRYHRIRKKTRPSGFRITTRKTNGDKNIHIVSERII